MDEYRKTFWGLQTLLRWKGSAVPRAFPFTVVAVAEVAILQFFGDRLFNSLRSNWERPYPFQAFAVVIGFLTVFRCAPAL
jgi:predicted membrane chloride channel (bestrophin family)